MNVIRKMFFATAMSTLCLLSSFYGAAASPSSGGKQSYVRAAEELSNSVEMLGRRTTNLRGAQMIQENALSKLKKTNAVAMAMSSIPSYVEADKTFALGAAAAYVNGAHGLAGAIDARAADIRLRLTIGADAKFDVKGVSLGISKNF